MVGQIGFVYITLEVYHPARRDILLAFLLGPKLTFVPCVRGFSVAGVSIETDYLFRVAWASPMWGVLIIIYGNPFQTGSKDGGALAETSLVLVFLEMMLGMNCYHLLQCERSSRGVYDIAGRLKDVCTSSSQSVGDPTCLRQDTPFWPNELKETDPLFLSIFDLPLFCFKQSLVCRNLHELFGTLRQGSVPCWPQIAWVTTRKILWRSFRPQYFPTFLFGLHPRSWRTLTRMVFHGNPSCPPQSYPP